MLKAPEIDGAAAVGAAAVGAAVVGAAIVGATVVGAAVVSSAAVSVDAVRANACVDNSSDRIVAGANSCSNTSKSRERGVHCRTGCTTPTAESINTVTIFCIV